MNSRTEDLEALYGLAVAYTAMDDLDTAMKYVKRAAEAGLPFGRFYAGPRNLLEPLLGHAAFRDYAKSYSVELVHGPVLGAVTPHSVSLKIRTAHEASVKVRVSVSEDISDPIESKAVHTGKQADYTATAKVVGLAPCTHYYYEVSVNGRSVDADTCSFGNTYAKCAGTIPDRWRTSCRHCS